MGLVKTNTFNTGENPEGTPLSNDFPHELRTLQDEISKINNLDKWYVGPKGSKSKDTIEKKNKPEKTHTNPKSGLTYNQYDQYDPRWKDIELRNGITIGKAGGDMIAIACIASSANPLITPKDAAEYRGQFPDHAIPKITNNKIKSDRLTIDDNTNNRIKKHLEKGYPAIIVVKGRKGGGQNKLAGTQQFLAIVDYRNNNGKEEVFIANTDKGWVPLNEAFVSIKEATLFTPTGK